MEWEMKNLATLILTLVVIGAVWQAHHPNTPQATVAAPAKHTVAVVELDVLTNAYKTDPALKDGTGSYDASHLLIAGSLKSVDYEFTGNQLVLMGSDPKGKPVQVHMVSSTVNDAVALLHYGDRIVINCLYGDYSTGTTTLSSCDLKGVN